MEDNCEGSDDGEGGGLGRVASSRTSYLDLVLEIVVMFKTTIKSRVAFIKNVRCCIMREAFMPL